MSISDGTRTFTVREQGTSETDANLGSGTDWSFFDTIFGSQGNDNLSGGADADMIEGGAGNDSITGRGRRQH